ncbi:RNA polymerase II transcription factor B subunit 4 [Cladophialophora chaetospira]|uniref:General transcription and DNA repair factor IIH subunit TFB4 n=1 Tax=Cladophialophora chaetospira TaxID=386627 RepID=A0AA38X099_9EURO|nr:RNA polymerase II transcription factor B subunit 4 [Cladophialophora chaetospira]
MNAIDGSEQYDKPSRTSDQSPSLLTVILDTNPAAWSLLSSTLPLSSAVANILVFINAHLAANYTNKVAVIASHCDKAQWLYPSPTEQKLPRSVADRNQAKRQSQAGDQLRDTTLSDSAKRLKLNGPSSGTSIKLNVKGPSASANSGSKYRLFRLVEEELLHNLTVLLSSTSTEAVASSTSTMIAGALTLALSYINRESIAISESLTGSSGTTGNAEAGAGGGEGASPSLQSRILLISASPSTDLAHQYIPIMNAIFACQRLSIPIDILQLPLPSTAPSSETSTSSNANATVFLQQAADATHGVFIPAHLSSPSTSSRNTQADPHTIASQAFLTYLLTSLLPSPSTRSTHLILPTRIDVDFRAACFCHRNVVSVGFVCSICLSIFCEPPEGAECLTCGTVLAVGEGIGRKPVVVGAGKKKSRKQAAGR